MYLGWIIEDILVKVDKFIFLTDFLIFNVEEARDIPLILDQPFSVTSRALIDVQKGHLILRLGEEQIAFHMFKAIKFPIESDNYFQIDVIDKTNHDTFQLDNPSDSYEACIVHTQCNHPDSNEIEICVRILKLILHISADHTLRS